MDHYFDVYLMSGKVLQLKADTVERQAQLMAMLKVGIGKGTSGDCVNRMHRLDGGYMYLIAVR